MSKMLRAVIAAGAMLLSASGSSSIVTVPDPLAAGVPDGDYVPTPLSLMTYNVAGLPWPVAADRSPALARIAGRLSTLRRTAQQPHIVLLQEAFTPEAAAIARTSGYPHAAFGPDERERSTLATSAADRQYLQDPRWDRGEGWGKQVGSGLIVLADFPILRVDRLAFPDFACAGFDCLANKGAVMVQLRVPGYAAPVAVVNTHLNARKAAGVPIARSRHAYARQVDLLADFIASHVRADQALLIGGDMNIGKDAARARHFFAAFDRAGLPFVAPHLGGAQRALVQAAIMAKDARADLRASSGRRKDWVFAREPAGAVMAVAQAQVPFGSERSGPALSDHVGYVIDYAAPPTMALAMNDRTTIGRSRR